MNEGMPVPARITRVIPETPSVATFEFDVEFSFTPGQFVMVWVPGVDEVPMALSSASSITVQRVGDATAALFRLGPGDSIGIRGPFGNGFPRGKKMLAVAGGVGAAPSSRPSQQAGWRRSCSAPGPGMSCSSGRSSRPLPLFRSLPMTGRSVSRVSSLNSSTQRTSLPAMRSSAAAREMMARGPRPPRRVGLPGEGVFQPPPVHEVRGRYLRVLLHRPRWVAGMPRWSDLFRGSPRGGRVRAVWAGRCRAPLPGLMASGRKFLYDNITASFQQFVLIIAKCQCSAKII